MSRKIIAALMLIVLSVSLCGCWDYRGLNDIAIVSGIAIDRDLSTGNYVVNFEIIDITSSSKDKSMQPCIVTTTGYTLFDAIRNAKRRLVNKLFFPSAEIVIISHQIASQDGIESVIDFLLRDGEPRETMNIVISQESTAKELLVTEGIDRSIVSYLVKESINEDNELTASTSGVEMYQVYGILNASGKALFLPVFHNVMNDDKLVSESNGSAVFNKDKFIGYLTPEETKYCLFVTNQIKGGLFSMSYLGKKENRLSFEVLKSKTDLSFEVTGSTVTVNINVKSIMALAEVEAHVNALETDVIDKITDQAEEELEKRIIETIQLVQSQYNSDIFGFGNMIQKRNLKLWGKIGSQWNENFKKILVHVNVEISIPNTAYIKS